MLRSQGSCMALLVSAAMPLTACGDGESCERFFCQVVEVEEQHAPREESWITWNGNSMPIPDVESADGAQPGRCITWLGRPRAYTRLPGTAPTAELTAAFVCQVNEVIYSWNAPLGDLAGVELGERGVRGSVYARTEAGKILTAGLGYRYATLDVLEATGTVEEFPTLVTPDFVRVVRLDVPGGQVSAIEPDVAASLKFEITADAYAGYHTTCTECAL